MTAIGDSIVRLEILNGMMINSSFSLEDCFDIIKVARSFSRNPEVWKDRIAGTLKAAEESFEQEWRSIESIRAYAQGLMNEVTAMIGEKLAVNKYREFSARLCRDETRNKLIRNKLIGEIVRPLIGEILRDC